MNDVMKAWLGALGFGLLCLLGLMLWFGLAGAQVIGYRATSILNVETDSSLLPACSCKAYWAQSTFGGDADSMRRLNTLIPEPEGYGKPDSLARYVIFTAPTTGAYNPSFFFYWYLSASCTTGAPIEVLRDNAPQITHTLVHVDSLQETFSATIADADFTRMADTIWKSSFNARDDIAGSFGDSAQGWGATGAGVSGSGPWNDTVRVVDTSAAPDDTIKNQEIAVHNLPRTVRYQANTGTNGLKAIFKLDAQAWTFSVASQTYVQDGGIDTITAPAKDTAFTL